MRSRKASRSTGCRCSSGRCAPPTWISKILDWYYEDCVIGGPGAFMIPVRGLEAFPEGTRTKLVLDIASAPGDPKANPLAARLVGKPAHLLLYRRNALAPAHGRMMRRLRAPLPRSFVAFESRLSRAPTMAAADHRRPGPRPAGSGEQRHGRRAGRKAAGSAWTF